jgi:hypothetical protein
VAEQIIQLVAIPSSPIHVAIGKFQAENFRRRDDHRIGGRLPEEPRQRQHESEQGNLPHDFHMYVPFCNV